MPHTPSPSREKSKENRTMSGDFSTAGLFGGVIFVAMIADTST